MEKTPSITTLDLTGGAPELNSQFRYLVTEVHLSIFVLFECVLVLRVRVRVRLHVRVRVCVCVCVRVCVCVFMCV